MNVFPVSHTKHCSAHTVPGRRARRWWRPQLEVLEARRLLSAGFNEFVASNAIAIATGPDGNLWFAEDTGNRIGRITPSGTVTEFNVPTAHSNPEGITAGPDGNLWFTEYTFDKIGRITPAGIVTEFATGITPGSSPNGITAGPDGNLWFTEDSGNRIGRITPSGTVTEFSSGITAFSRPFGIAAGADGNLWFTEYSGNRIGRITPSGAVTEFSTGITASSQPTGIAARPDGNLWFTESDRSNGNRIGRITLAGTVTEFSTGIAASCQPTGITAGGDGNLWFTEYNGNQIGRITPAGIVTEFSTGLTPGASPNSIAAGPDGNLWFTEGGYKKIGRFTVPREFPVPTLGSASHEITSGPDGNLWFAEYFGNKVGRITPSGSVTEYAAGITASSQPEGITAGPDGNLWFAELNGDKIGRITPSGNVTEFPLPTTGAAPYLITGGPDGNLWFTEDFANKIGRITPSGSVTEFNVPTASSQPRGITAGPDGNLWFAEGFANKIGRITPSGSVTEFNVPTASSQPIGITAGPDGNLWFAELNGDKIGRLTPSGNVTEFNVPTANSSPDDITAGADGNLWFTESTGTSIGRITPMGAVTEFSVATTASGLSGITAGADGNLWFTEFYGDNIGRVNVLSASGTASNAAPGQPFSGVLASVMPYDPLTRASDLTALINWGDGTVTNGVLTGTGSSGFAISGTHTYLQSGTNIATVTVTNINTPTNLGLVPESVSANATITVAPAATTTTLASNFSPSPAGQPVTFLATVTTSTPSLATVTGFVQFWDSTTGFLGSAALSGGVAALTPPTLTAGTHSVYAVFAGNASFAGSTSATITQQVNPGPATHFLVSPAAATTSAGAALNVTVTALDAYNNTATGYSGTVSLGSSDAQAVLPGPGPLGFATTAFSTNITPGSSPLGIAAGPDGNLWFTEKTASKIGRITPSGAVTEFATGITPTSMPLGITAGPDGNLWFTENSPGKSKIGRITPSGTVTEFATGITLNSGPTGIVAGPDGNLWFTESSAGKIARITPSGTVTEFSVGPGSAPYAITAGPDGNLWFTDQFSGQIGRITTSGTVTEFFLFAGSRAEGITAGPDGNLWFTDPTGNQIGRITPSGGVTEYNAGITANSGLEGITAGPDGNLWFTENTTAYIGRITPNGAITEFGAAGDYLGPFGITAGPNASLWFTESSGNQIDRVSLGIFSVTLKTAGTQSLTATDTVNSSITGTSAAITVRPAAAAHFAVSGPLGITAGVVFGVTVTAQDPYGNTVTNYNGTVHFSSTASSAALPANSTLTQGLGTFPTTLFTAGNQTVTATDMGSSSITGASNTIVVNPTADPTFTVTAPATAITGVPFSFTVTAHDEFNNVATRYGGTVHFTSTDPLAQLAPTSATLTNGVGTFTATLLTGGSQTITATDANVLAVTGTTNPIVTRGLVVQSISVQPGGFTLTFNKPFDPSALNLYDGGSNLLGPTDLTLVGATGGPIANGSLVVTSPTTLTYVYSFGVLPDDAYTLTLRSAANAFKDLSGTPLDGANSGTAGTNFTTTFSTSFNAANVGLVMPSFARGPGQTVSLVVPGSSPSVYYPGLPIQLSDGDSVTSAGFTLTYNTALLTITGAVADSSGAYVSAPAGSTFTRTAHSVVSGMATDVFAFSTNGHGNLGMGAGPVTIGELTATIPNTPSQTIYKAKQVLSISGVSVNGSLPGVGVGASGIQVVAYPADASGDGAYAGNDASLVGRVAGGQDTGFAAFPLVDPVVLADLAGDGVVTASDASQISQVAVHRPGLPNITPVPSGAQVLPSTAPDPLLSIPTSLRVAADGTVSVPVNLDEARPAGSTGLTEATLALRFDPSVFTVSAGDIHLGSIPQAGRGWTLTSSVDAATGQLAITLYSLTPIASNLAGSLVTIDFHSQPGAVGTSSIQLAASVDPSGQGSYVTNVADSNGAMILGVVPTNTVNPALDGTVVVLPSQVPAVTVVTYAEVAASVEPQLVASVVPVVSVAILSSDDESSTPAVTGCVDTSSAHAATAVAHPAGVVGTVLSQATAQAAAGVFQFGTQVVPLTPSVPVLPEKHWADRVFQAAACGVVDVADLGQAGQGAQDAMSQYWARQPHNCQGSALDGLDDLDLSVDLGSSALSGRRQTVPSPVPQAALTDPSALSEYFARLAPDDEVDG
jgi:streptogramin lyase